MKLNKTNTLRTISFLNEQIAREDEKSIHLCHKAMPEGMYLHIANEICARLNDLNLPWTDGSQDDYCAKRNLLTLEELKLSAIFRKAFTEAGYRCNATDFSDFTNEAEARRGVYNNVLAFIEASI